MGAIVAAAAGAPRAGCRSRAVARVTSTAFGPGCPWYDLHLRFPPNIDWCEEKLCALVVTPFNTWSNLGYLVVAVWMAVVVRRDRDTVLVLFAPATAVAGLTSFVYHQSLNAFSQLLDFLGMFGLCMLLLMANLQRMRRWPAGARGLARYAGAVLLLTACSAAGFWLGFPAQWLVAMLIALIIASEWLLPAPSRRFFWLAMSTLGLASVLSALDLTRAVCQSANHWLQLHGLWHLLTAAAIGLVFVHLRRAYAAARTPGMIQGRKTNPRGP